MDLNRRELIALGCLYAAGCATTGENEPRALMATDIDAGPVGNYKADGVYDQHVSQGFFIVRHGDQLTALSAICTHRTCRLHVDQERTIRCKCHGSTFNSNGAVTEGPAKLPLPVLPTTVDSSGRLMVKAIVS